MNTKKTTAYLVESNLDTTRALLVLTREILKSGYTATELRDTKDSNDDSILQNLEMAMRQIKAAAKQIKRLASR